MLNSRHTAKHNRNKDLNTMNGEESSPDTNTSNSTDMPRDTVTPPGQRLAGTSSEKPKKPMWLVVVLVLVVIAAAVLAGHMWPKSSTKVVSTSRVVKIGLLAPLTGDFATYGQMSQHGVEMAQRDFNKPGLSFQIYVRDTQCDPAKATAATQELADLKVIAIVGDTCSSSTVAALPIANQHHIVMISPSASTPALSIANDYFFRTYPTDNHEGPFTATYMTKRNIKSVAIFHTNEAYGNGLDKAMVTSFESQGGKVVTDSAFTPGDVNFATQLATIKAANPAALYIITNNEVSGAAIVTEARQAGLTMPIYGSDGLKDATFVHDIGKDGEGMTVISVSPGNQAYLSEYEATYGSAPAAASGPQAYDAFTALAKVISNGATTGEQIKQALPKLDFQGKSGEIKFDKYGDLAGGGYTVYTIKNEQFVLSN